VGAAARKIDEQVPILELARRVGTVLPANERAIWEWHRKYERLGEERVQQPNYDFIHAVSETDSGVAVFLCDVGYQSFLQKVHLWAVEHPPIRKSIWEEFFDIVHWTNNYWGPLPLPYYVPKSIGETEMTKDEMKVLVEAIQRGPDAKKGFRWDIAVPVLAVCLTIIASVAGSTVWVVSRLDKVEAGLKEELKEIRIEQVKQGQRVSEMDGRLSATSTDTR